MSYQLNMTHSTYNVYAIWLLILSMILLLFGCSSTPDSTDTSTQDTSSTDEKVFVSSTDEQIFVPSTDEQIFVGDSIEMSYDPNVIMKRAESFFEKESYAEAIVEYKHFLDLHQNHTLAPYAQYKIGVSHYKQFRTVDRDPEPLIKAISGFERLLKEFPASRYEAEAKETILTCQGQLIQRHLMVGEFYYKRGSYLAAAHRYEKIINEFPELETTGEAMFHLAKTYQELGIEEWSQEWLVALIRQYPNSSYHSSAQSLLASIHKEHPTLLASLPKNPLQQENSSIISASADTTLPLAPDTSVFANAGVLPDTTIAEAQTAVLTEQIANPSSCTIGAWCDSQSAIPTQAITPTAPSSANTKACKTGDWC
jgi:outer membrane protein assembly factor BamD